MFFVFMVFKVALYNQYGLIQRMSWQLVDVAT